MSPFYIKAHGSRKCDNWFLCDPTFLAEPGTPLRLQSVVRHPWRWNGDKQIVHFCNPEVCLGLKMGVPTLCKTSNYDKQKPR